MTKKITIKVINIFIFFLCFINLANAQHKLNKENKAILKQSIKTILDIDEESDDAYLLSFDDDNDDAFLIYKFENNFIITINKFTSNKAIISTDQYKAKVTALKGTTTLFKHVTEDTGEIIEVIPTYKFDIPLQKTDQLETVIVSLLLKNIESQPKLVFKYAFN